MPTIDPNEFWTQALSSLLAGILVLLVQPQWLVGLFRPRTNSARSPNDDGHFNHGGNQLVIAEGSTVTGGIQQKNKYVNNSQQTTIITNIHAATRGGKNSDADVWVQLILTFVAGVVAVGLFLLFRPVFMALTLGATGGLLLLTIAAVVRSCRDLHPWPPQAKLAALVVPVTSVIMAASWISVSATVRGSLSLDQIRADLPPSDISASDASLSDYVGDFLHATFPAIVDMGPPAILFVASLLGGLLLALALVVSAWFLVLNWHAYLRFTDSTDAGAVTARRADSFAKRTAVREIVTLMVIGGVALACSAGLFYDLFQFGRTQLELGVLAMAPGPSVGLGPSWKAPS